MPLMGHFSYPETMDEFLAHWALVDADLVSGGLPALEILTGSPPAGMGRAGFAALAAALRAKGEALRSAEVTVRVNAGALALAREAMLEALRLFTDTVRAWWAARPEAGLVPLLPGKGMALDAVLKTAREALRLWDRINAGPVLPGMPLPLAVGPAPGVDRAAFAALLAAIGPARLALEDAEFAAAALRSERDALERPVRAALSAYGRAVPVRLGAEHPLVDSLPRLNPLPGHTPDPVVVRAVWDPAAQAARLDWDPSADAAVVSYQVRWCPGEKYRKKDERVALTLPAAADPAALPDGADPAPDPEAPAPDSAGAAPATEAALLGGSLSALVRHGLTSPGAAACYKVYVILKTGNERGSRAVTVVRGA